MAEDDRQGKKLSLPLLNHPLDAPEAHRVARGVWAAAESEEESNVTCRLQRKGR